MTLLPRERAIFGERLAQLLAASPLGSQSELARRSGLAESQISALLRGTRNDPSLSTLLALKKGLRLGSVEELLGPMPSESYSVGRSE